MQKIRSNEMDEINQDFNIPFYIFEEILKYTELTAKGNCKTAKWQNIKALLKLAKIINQLSKQQVEHIMNTYCLEYKIYVIIY